MGARIGSNCFTRSFPPPPPDTAECAGDLIGVAAEDVRDDLLTVSGVDFADVDAVVEKAGVGVRLQRAFQRGCAGGILRVGAEATDEGRKCSLDRRFGSCLVDAELLRDLVDGDLG